MKKPLIIFALLAGAVSSYSQGQIVYYDYATSQTSGFKIQVYTPNPANPSTSQYGQTATSVPSGTTVFGGYLIGLTSTIAGAYGFNVGSDYSVTLYAGAGTLSSYFSLTGIPSTTEPLYSSFSASYAGIWTAPSQTITFGGPNGTPGAPTVAAGSPVSVVLAAWYNGGGTLTFAQAVGGGGPYGWSQIGTELTGGAGDPPSIPPFLPALGASQTIAGGITSFSFAGDYNVNPIPEPSTLAFGVIGASAFLMRLRCKK
jgi:hypothetical protein